MSDSVDRVFVHALNTVKRIPRTGSARPPPADRLKLYGLYKQSIEGNVEGLLPRPSGNDPDSAAEREKWDAWHAHNSLSRTEAKRRYISALIETMHKYATTTPEARGLVSELEFVWDQIKSNSVSSSDSSPEHSAAPGQQQVTGSSYQGGRAEVSESGLRVLRPVSDAYGEDEEGDGEGEEDEEARHAPLDGNSDPAVAGVTQSADLHIRNRKWRRRIEHTLVKRTAEIAALREQLEAKRSGDLKRRHGVWAWITWLVWVTLRHFLVDLAILGILVFWARRGGDRRVERGLEALLQYVRKRASKVRVPEILRAPSRRS